MAKKKSLKCIWQPYSISNGKEFEKCAVCGRIKRKDVPDAQNCSGSEASYRTMYLRMMGHDLTEKDLQEIEKKSTHQ